MTPDQLKDYVDGALPHRDNLPALYLTVAQILTLLGIGLVAYMTQKGKNLATKEDIRAITTEIKSVESGFDESLERLKESLKLQSHFSQVRYEHEIKVFENLWPKVWRMCLTVNHLGDDLSFLKCSEDERLKRQTTRVDEFVSAHVEMRDAIWQNRPFFPPQIWKELLALHNLLNDKAAFCLVCLKGGVIPEQRVEIIKSQKEISEHFDRVCDAIRNRLTEYD